PVRGAGEPPGRPPRPDPLQRLPHDRRQGEPLVSAYSPTLPRTAEPHGTDRLLVLVGSALTDLGRRRAAQRAASARPRAAAALPPAIARPPQRTTGAAEDRTLAPASTWRASLLP